MVDPSIQSLNRFTDNIGKAEALFAEIANILRSSVQCTTPLIIKDQSPWLVSRRAKVRSKVSGGATRKQKGGKPRKSATLKRKAGPSSVVKPKEVQPVPQPLPVSRGLLSRYNREGIYDKVWKMPFTDLAKEYKMTNDTLRKVCERLWIPFPGRGYLERRAAGQPVIPQPPLPKVQVERRERANGTRS